MKTTASRVLASLFTLSAAIPCVLAQTTWDGGGGADTSWGNSANWDNDTLPAFDGTDSLTVTSGYSGNTSLTLGADRTIGRITFGGGGTPTSLSGNTLILSSTTTSAGTGTALWNSNTNDGDPSTINSDIRLQSGTPGTYTGYFRENVNSNGGTWFYGTITEGAGEDWTLRFSGASSRKNFYLANAANSFTELRNDGATVLSRAAGAFGGGTVTLAGGTTGTSTADHYNTPVNNDITLASNSTWSSGIQTQLTGTLTQSGFTLTFDGGANNLTRLDFASVSGTGQTTVRHATLAVSSMSQLSGGTLNLGNTAGQGIFVLSGGSGNGVPTWSDFIAARTFNQSGGAGTWRIDTPAGDTDNTYPAGGFAARGADLVIPHQSAPNAGGITDTTFTRNFILGSAANLDGVRYASNSVTIETDISYGALTVGDRRYFGAAANAGVTKSNTGLTLAGPVHELAGVISGSDVIIYPMGGSGEGTTNFGMIRISNASNSLTGTSRWVIGGSRSTFTTTDGGTITGPGNMGDTSSGALIFTSDGAFGGATEVMVSARGSSGTNNSGILLLEDATGTGTTFTQNVNYANFQSGSNPAPTFGAYGGEVVYQGTLNFAGSNGSLLLHAETGSSLEVDGGSLVNNNTASTTLNKTGGGTWTLTDITLSGSQASNSWFVREGTLQVNQDLNHGNMSVSPGATLEFGNGGTTGSLDTSRTINNTGTVSFRQSDTVTQGVEFGTSAISGSGGLAQNGSGTLVMNNTLSYLGTTVVNSGTLQFDGATHTVGQDYTVNGGTLDLQAGTLTTPNVNVNGGNVVSDGGTLNATTLVLSNGGGLDHSNGTLNIQDLFHINGSGGTIQIADFPDTTDGTADLRFTADLSGVSTIELTDSTPFGRYGDSLTDWANEWTIDLKALGSIDKDSFTTLNLFTSSAYDLSQLNNELTISAYNIGGAPALYENVANGDVIYLSSGGAIGSYTVEFTTSGFNLVFESAFAIPEPGTLSLIGLALLALRRRLRRAV